MTTQERIDKMLKKSEAILNAGKQTNEEYLKSCTTEQLAEWLNNKIIICAVCDQQKICEYFTNETCHLCPYHEGKNKSWEVWLKQPHKE